MHKKNYSQSNCLIVVAINVSRASNYFRVEWRKFNVCRSLLVLIQLDFRVFIVRTRTYSVPLCSMRLEISSFHNFFSSVCLFSN